MKVSRREMIRSTASTVTSTLFVAGPFADRLSAQTSSASAGSPKYAPRMPLHKFLESERLLKALRKGVAAMKERKSYDPFSWFYQAAIHGVTPEAVDRERDKLKKEGGDAEVAKLNAVFQKRYWNQCPHNGEEAANFLPWHRAYTYYFEKILRLHTEEPDFSLPYWDYKPKECRKFPKAFGERFIDGNEHHPNPLFLHERDYYFTRYDHPFAKGLPLLELTDDAVDDSMTLASPVFFGTSEQLGVGGGFVDENPNTRGLLESRPHDHIHRAVGGVIDQPVGKPFTGAMSQPPTAAFDPIFPVHHSNIDRLWAVWQCMPGKSWGWRPPNHWFHERAWYFWDIGPGNQPVAVNQPRKNYFSYRALGIEFEGLDPNCKPLELPNLDVEPKRDMLAVRTQTEAIAAESIELSVLPRGRSVVSLSEATKAKIGEPLKAFRNAADSGKSGRLLLQLTGVDLGMVPATGFDVHVTTSDDADVKRSGKSFVGSIALFRHQAVNSTAEQHSEMDGGHGSNVGHEASHSSSETFDITEVVATLGDNDLNNLRIVIMPYPLLTMNGNDSGYLTNAKLQVGGMEFLRSLPISE